MKKAIFPLSADPITLGHLNIIERASNIFDEIVVLVLENQTKQNLFSLVSRTELVEKCLAKNDKVTVISYEGLLTDFAVKHDIFNIIRGIRDTADLEYEIFLESGHRKQQAAKMEFCYFLADEKFRTIKSSFVKAILLAYGSVVEYVPVLVKKKLEMSYLKQQKILITGGIASGKSYLMKALADYLNRKKIKFVHVDFDEIVAEIYGSFSGGGYPSLQQEMVDYFGETILDDEGKVSKQKISSYIFSDKPVNKSLDDEASRHLGFLETVLSPHILVKYREVIKGKEGWVFLNAPIDGLGSKTPIKEEMDILKEVNYDVLLVDVDDETQVSRLVTERGVSETEARSRVKMNSATNKRELLTAKLEEVGGQLVTYRNDRDITDRDFEVILGNFS